MEWKHKIFNNILYLIFYHISAIMYEYAFVERLVRTAKKKFSEAVVAISKVGGMSFFLLCICEPSPTRSKRANEHGLNSNPQNLMIVFSVIHHADSAGDRLHRDATAGPH